MIRDIKNASFQADVVILAGGFGTRLISEIGTNTPKPMAEINGVPLLEHQIRLCKKYQFNKILILVHHLSEIIIDYFKDGSDFGVEIHYSYENNPRGTAGAILDSINKLEDQFLVIYGDTYLDVDLRRFFNSKGTEEVLTFCHPNSHPYDSDLLKLDANDMVTNVFRPSKSGEKLYKNLVNAALYVLDKEIFLSFVNRERPMDISSELFPILLKNNKRIKAYKSVEFIRDIGTPDRFKSVNKSVQDGTVSSLSSSNKRRCVFIDRDGTINKEKGYISNINDFEILPRISKAISILNNSGFLAICITNQPVIARGELSFNGLSDIHMKMEVELGNDGAYLDDIFFCPHHPHSGFEGEILELKFDCECRKPKPGLIMQAIKKYNIDVNNSWMVGDHSRDIQSGLNAGLSVAFIGNTKSNQKLNTTTKSFDDLFAACEFIIKESNNT
ncbi:HAD-IIIA family hydrolase [Gammaproteobacteria bacterium]|nr:HAD-IIIA family hydrolase [Gammaproteobacteria bacterium]